MQSSADAVQAANLTQAFSDTNATLSPAITLQLAAQAALYIICCASLVLACVVAFIRLRQLNHALIESQKFVMQHQNKVRERASVQRKESLLAHPSDCDDDCRRITSAATAGGSTATLKHHFAAFSTAAGLVPAHDLYDVDIKHSHLNQSINFKVRSSGVACSSLCTCIPALRVPAPTVRSADTRGICLRPTSALLQRLACRSVRRASAAACVTRQRLLYR